MATSYYDDPDQQLLLKGWQFPLDGQLFAGRQATINLGDFTPWWDVNTLNWKLLIYARDWAWQMNQGLTANYQQVLGQWVKNNQDRPGQAGPKPIPPRAYAAITEWVPTGQQDGEGNDLTMFYRFDVRQVGDAITLDRGSAAGAVPAAKAVAAIAGMLAPVPVVRKRRKMSAAGRARIAAAQKARWAKKAK